WATLIASAIAALLIGGYIIALGVTGEGGPGNGCNGCEPPPPPLTTPLRATPPPPLTTPLSATPPPPLTTPSHATSVTGYIDAGQTTAFKPASGLHDQETIHVVATGLTPRGEYGAFECKSDSPPDDANCVDGIQLGTADASGTVRIDYTAQEGP